MVENRGFLDVLKPGQRILADRGFTARDLIDKCILDHPLFLRGAPKLTRQQTMETPTVASVRICVENAITQLKDSCLLSAILPNRMNKSILDDIFVQFATTTHHMTIVTYCFLITCLICCSIFNVVYDVTECYVTINEIVSLQPLHHNKPINDFRCKCSSIKIS